MLEDSVPSMWTSMGSWFTPTVLFLLLNLVIGTIALTSGLINQKTQPREGKQPHLDRAPSVLERLKSINLYRYRSEEMNPFPSITTSLQPPEMETQQPPELVQEETLDQNPDQFHDLQFARTKSDTQPTSGEMPAKLPKKMKKSASAKSAFGHFEEEEIVERRPSTVREGKSKATEKFGEDEEVDAKADDFINKFKKQLQLQRLDSILRYKEMITRGSK